jgi:hypothetical protein
MSFVTTIFFPSGDSPYKRERGWENDSRPSSTRARRERDAARGDDVDSLELDRLVVAVGGRVLREHLGGLCRGARARVTIDRCRHLSLSSFKKHRASTSIFSTQFQDLYKRHLGLERVLLRLQAVDDLPWGVGTRHC